MKKKSLKLRLAYFFGQRIRSAHSSGHMPKLIKPESQGEGAESVIEAILRWADDGGKSLELVGNQTAKANPDTAWNRNNKSEYQQKRKRNGKVSGNNDSPSNGT
jgi:hypothetical protein